METDVSLQNLKTQWLDNFRHKSAYAVANDHESLRVAAILHGVRRIAHFGGCF